MAHINLSENDPSTVKSILIFGLGTDKINKSEFIKPHHMCN